MSHPVAIRRFANGPCKTRPPAWLRVLVCLTLAGLPIALSAQEPSGDAAWVQGRFTDARQAYRQALATDPAAVRPNLRLGLLLSWEGKLDSALVYLARARASDPQDPEIRVIQARVLAWNAQYAAALLRYDSLLAENPSFRDALLGRAQTLAWSGRWNQAQREYGRILANATDRKAILGARVGLGYVNLWQSRGRAAARQARYALAIDSTDKEARELYRLARQRTSSGVESSASWGNDSDENTGFWQTLGSSAGLSDEVGVFGSVNALQASDPVRNATRVGAEAGITISSGQFQLTGAAGARRLTPEVAPARTAETYRTQVRYRPSGRWGASVGYARLPFDEIASLFERNLDLELLEAGIDVQPLRNLRIAAGGGGLWLSDGNERTSASLGLTQTIRRRFTVGLLGKTLRYAQQGIGYFSPDRFSVLEANAGYNLETRTWTGSVSGGVGAQQVGRRGVAQSQWHFEGRAGPQWGDGNRFELFGLITNSALSSTTGAFRYRSAGISLKLGL